MLEIIQMLLLLRSNIIALRHRGFVAFSKCREEDVDANYSSYSLVVNLSILIKIQEKLIHKKETAGLKDEIMVFFSDKHVFSSCLSPNNVFS